MVSTVNTSLLVSRTDRNGHALLGSPALPVHSRSVYTSETQVTGLNRREACVREAGSPGLPGWLCAMTLSRTQVPMTFLSAVPGVLPLLGQPKLSQTMSMVHEQPRKAWMEEKGSPISKTYNSTYFIILTTTLSHGDSRCQGRLENAVLTWVTMCPDKTDYCEVRVMFVMLSKFQNIRSDRIVISIP